MHSRERERYYSIKWKCIRQWCFLFGCIIVMITTDYGIGEYVLELSNHDRRQNTTINFHAGFNFQRGIIDYIEFAEPSVSLCASSVVIIGLVGTTSRALAHALLPKRQSSNSSSDVDRGALLYGISWTQLIDYIAAFMIALVESTVIPSSRQWRFASAAVTVHKSQGFDTRYNNCWLLRWNAERGVD